MVADDATPAAVTVGNVETGPNKPVTVKGGNGGNGSDAKPGTEGTTGGDGGDYRFWCGDAVGHTQNVSKTGWVSRDAAE